MDQNHLCYRYTTGQEVSKTGGVAVGCALAHRHSALRWEQTIRGKNPRGPRWFKPRSSEVRLPSRQRAEPLDKCPIEEERTIVSRQSVMSRNAITAVVACFSHSSGYTAPFLKFRPDRVKTPS